MQKKSYWMWHSGDYEIYHSMKVNMRRQEFGADYPTFWQVHSPYITVKFHKQYEGGAGYISAHTNGKGYLLVDGHRYSTDTTARFSAGKHTFEAVIYKESGLPALFIDSDVCPGDNTWICNHNAGAFLPAGIDPYFDSMDKDPEVFPFVYERKDPVRTEALENGVLFDFGKELFGYIHIAQDIADRPLGVFYGESREEALDTENTLVFERVSGQKDYTFAQRAFRYIYVEGTADDCKVWADYEYLPLERKGSFRCNDPLFEQVYDVCAHTFHLNCREGFLDGIKRDRWVWSGDAYQSARINSYLFADPAIVKRTAIGLAGKPPVEQFMNTIMDYTTLWIIGVYEYYMTYSDTAFLKQMSPMMDAHIAFCETRLNADGFVQGKDGDWIFIDWSDIDKTGAVCAEQMLLAAAYDTMAAVDEILHKGDRGYADKAAALKQKINRYYWDDEKGAFISSYQSGHRHVTRHANIFAVMYGIATPEQTDSILHNVLKNDSITKIITPYFKGYELDVLAKLGEFDEIEEMLHSYWGGMLALGATSVWEEFDPTLEGAAHYAMYGNKYGKSLCHAWGAGPIYLFGRYYLGVYPTAPGYKTFRVEPHAGGLKSFEGTVPLGTDGQVQVSLDNGKITVLATKAGGTLLWNGKEYVLEPNITLTVE